MTSQSLLPIVEGSPQVSTPHMIYGQVPWCQWPSFQQLRNHTVAKRSALSKRTRTLGHYHTEPY